MWGQRNSQYDAAVGTQLLARIHKVETMVGNIDHQQNHPVNCLEECIDFIGDVSDYVGRVIDELNGCIDMQEIQIKQLANMVNNLIRKIEGQAKEIKALKTGQEEHHQVINTMTAKVIALEQCTKDIQKKVFPKVGGELLGFDKQLRAFFLEDSRGAP
jgi:DNA repair ATPase RecN